jgi:tetratricopeptide (TPR) repeat protein
MTKAPAIDGARVDDIRVARVHLRLGQLTLARAELEDLLRRDQLDVDGLAFLAEARWRTGDADAAEDAAQAHLEAGGSDDIALCIAAEAAAADGRPGDARAVMERLPLADAETLDRLFAGMPRRAFWAAGPVDRSELEDLRPGADSRAGRGRRGGTDQRVARPDAPTELYRHGTDAPMELRAIPGPREVIEATAAASGQGSGAALEGEADTAAADTAAAQSAGRRGQRAPGHRIKAQLDPAVELERAREELRTKPERAILRFALVLRYDPTYAPAVLEALNLRREPAAALLRGDAQRLLGRHLEAEAAFDAAAESLETS